MRDTAPPRAGADHGRWRPGTRGTSPRWLGSTEMGCGHLGEVAESTRAGCVTSGRWRGRRGCDAATSAKWSRSWVRACPTIGDGLAERGAALPEPGVSGAGSSRGESGIGSPRASRAPGHSADECDAGPPWGTGEPARARHTDRPRSRASPHTAHEPARARHTNRPRARAGPAHRPPTISRGPGVRSPANLRDRGGLIGDRAGGALYGGYRGPVHAGWAWACADARPDRRPDDEGDA